jgi:hypothetical protein
MFYCDYFDRFFDSEVEYKALVKKQGFKSFSDFVKQHKPKQDMLTGEDIKLGSNFEAYLLKDFAGRKNQLAWLKLQEKAAAQEYLILSIKRYAEMKGLEYFPSHFELRTIDSLVSMKTYVHFFKNNELYKFIESSNLKNRYSYFSDLKFYSEFEGEITIDTREQKPIKFPPKLIKSKVEKLNYGDYSMNGIFSIERKSLSDLASTLSGGWERFFRECQRVVENNGYMVILVDSDVNDFLSLDFGGKKLYGKASAGFLMKRARDLCRSFPLNIQFLFSGGRKNSSILIPNLIYWGETYCSKLDLQYYKDSGAFKDILD